MNAQNIIPRDDAGKVYIENDTIYWDVEKSNVLEIRMESICVIGEYTTPHAVFKNDWFIVFVLDKMQNFQISAYAEGMEKVLHGLSKYLNSEIKAELALATSFKSNIIWPPHVAGKELYELKVKESKTFFDRFRARLGFGNPVELAFRDEVKQILQK